MDAVPKEYTDCCVKVMDYLYVGDRKAAKSKSLLEKLGITEIINVTIPRNQGGVHNFFEADDRFNYLRCPCVDSDVENISRYFLQSIKFIDEARNKGHSVLVHCQLGQSRSVTIALAYMISTREWNLTTAYTHLKTIRPRVKPKSNFLRQLIKFQAEYDQSASHNQEDEEEEEPPSTSNESKSDDTEPVDEKDRGQGHEDADGGDEDDDLQTAEEQQLRKKQTAESRKRKLEAKDNENGSMDDVIVIQNGPARKRTKLEESVADKQCLSLADGKEGRVFGMALPPHLVNQT